MAFEEFAMVEQFDAPLEELPGILLHLYHQRIATRWHRAAHHIDDAELPAVGELSKPAGSSRKRKSAGSHVPYRAGRVPSISE
jgi:hypothetical protein